MTITMTGNDWERNGQRWGISGDNLEADGNRIMLTVELINMHALDFWTLLAYCIVDGLFSNNCK